MRCTLLVLVLLLTTSHVLAIPWPARPVKLEPIPTPSDALTMAWMDCKALPPTERPYMRYIWCKEPSPEDGKQISFACNVISRSTLIHRPEPVGNERLLLLRMDLRKYAPREKDFREWLEFWEDFQFDPKFSLLITKDTLNFAAQAFPGFKAHGWVYRSKTITEPWRGGVWPGDGKEYPKGAFPHQRTIRSAQLEEVDLAKAKDVDLIRLPAPHLNQQAYAEMVEMTGSQAPVVSQGYFTYRAMSAIEDKGVYATIYGGRYYQFAGVRKNVKKGFTDEDVWLESIGVGNLTAGVTAKKFYDNLRSDRKFATFRSGVTGRPRAGLIFPSPAVALDTGTGITTLTLDLGRQDIDVGVHPMANLLEFKARAKEGIWERANGMHGYVLFNGEGDLQNVAPPDVAKDHTIPSPHSGDLQPPISCISCHEAEGSDGWRVVKNDVKTMLQYHREKKGPRLDVFGDITRLKESVPDTLDRLAGLYQGDPERAFIRGRNDYALNVLKATGPWKQSKGQTDVVKLTAQKTVAVWREYAYDLVTPEIALRELGVKVSDPKAAREVFEELLKPDLKAAVPVPELGQAVIPETFVIGALRAGIAVDRFDWDLQYTFAASRAARSLARMAEQRKLGKK